MINGTKARNKLLRNTTIEKLAKRFSKVNTLSAAVLKTTAVNLEVKWTESQVYVKPITCIS